MMRTTTRWTRRQLLQLGGASLTLGSLGTSGHARSRDERSVILLLLVGGPSQLDSFDPKPDAPESIRGPFRPIATRLPGVPLCEHLPGLARRLDRVTLVRSLYHDAAPIHETGHQLVQTGTLFRAGVEAPHVGARAAAELGGRQAAPPFVVIPGPIGSTGVAISHGQSAGPLGAAWEPTFRDVAAESALAGEPNWLRDAYGRTRFGDSCLLARRLVETGTRLVTVNMFESVFHAVSWDCHGFGPFSTLEDYARTVLPTFDRAFAALLDDLEARGLLETTLVIATGEFGRTPRINASGGRDHWPGVWSALLAGNGTPAGQVLGASDAIGSEPADQPFPASELAALMGRALGLS